MMEPWKRYIVDHDWRNGEYQVWDRREERVVDVWPTYRPGAAEQAMRRARELNDAAIGQADGPEEAR